MSTEKFDLDIRAMGREVLLRRAKMHERLSEIGDRHLARLHAECAALYRHTAWDAQSFWDQLDICESDAPGAAPCVEADRAPTAGLWSRMLGGQQV